MSPPQVLTPTSSNPEELDLKPERLIDYFVVIDFDSAKERRGHSVGKVLQRFPSEQWPDVPFFDGLHVFCNPAGWRVREQLAPPTFTIAALTDALGARHYGATLTFHEAHFGTAGDANGGDVDEPDAGCLSPLNRGDAPLQYLPKCIVIVSRHDCFDVFRGLLNTLFTAHLDPTSLRVKERPSLECMIAKLLANALMPPPGCPSVGFSLGAGDYTVLASRASAMVPVTGATVARLFRQLGTIHNLLCVFCGVLADCKVLFLSASYRRLTEACHALTSIIYPLKYSVCGAKLVGPRSYSFVPVLPESAMGVLESPAPFIMGAHSSLKPHTMAATDVICVDLDLGSVYIPDEIRVPVLPEPYYSHLVQCLTLATDPDLLLADLAFEKAGKCPGNKCDSGENVVDESVDLCMQDKLLRASFVRLFAELLGGYRAFLQVVRLSPKPVIHFHKAAFLGARGHCDTDLVGRLLAGMPFQLFVCERGPPYRTVDLFDELVLTMNSTLSRECGDHKLVKLNLDALARQLALNESSGAARVWECAQGGNASVTPTPSPAALMDPVPPKFPLLDEELVRQWLTRYKTERAAAASANNGSSKSAKKSADEIREVPCAGSSSRGGPLWGVSGPNARRLDVLTNCLKCIFDNRVTDARKMMSAVLLSMKNQTVRVAFCQQLHNFCNRSVLEPQQFDLLVRLMNCALENESASDEFGIAFALLTLSNTFCRRLTPGILQFAYTCVQEHQVWTNLQFWEAVFYHQVQSEIRRLYLPDDGKRDENENVNPLGPPLSVDAWNLCRQPTALQIAAEELKRWPSLSVAEKTDWSRQEQEIVQGQAMHFINLMVCILTPLDASRLRRVNVAELEKQRTKGQAMATRASQGTPLRGDGRRSGSSSDTSSNGSDDGDTEQDDRSDVESGFHAGSRPTAAGAGRGRLLAPPAKTEGDLGQATVRFISKFLDKVCSDAGVPVDQLRMLSAGIPGFVAAHIENLEQVYSESKRLPPIFKPKLLLPALMPGERVLLGGGMRVFLLPDGRRDDARSLASVSEISNPAKAASEVLLECRILPAEGALFLTNYRVIFKGQPLDPLICEQVVLRTLPVLAMTKEKRVDVSALLLAPAADAHGAAFSAGGGAAAAAAVAHRLHDALQIRSATFQLMRIAFDEEVPSARVEHFVSTLESHRWPESVFDLCALHNKLGMQAVDALRALALGELGKDKTVDNRTKQATLSGFAKNTLSKAARKAGLNKYGTGNFGTGTPAGRSTSTSAAGRSHFTISEDVEGGYRQSPLAGGTSHASPKQNRFTNSSHRSYVRDWDRLNLHTNGLRLCADNATYDLCPSYPSLLIVPAKCSAESLRKVAKCYKQQRFPVITWCSSRGAFLLRGGSFHPKNVVDRLKKAGAAGVREVQTIMDREAGNSSSSTLGAPVAPMRSSVEHERYLAIIASLSPGSHALGASGAADEDSELFSSSFGSLLSVDSLFLGGGSVSGASIATGGGANLGSGGAAGADTPELYRRSGTHLPQLAARALRASTGKGKKEGGTIGRAGGLYMTSSTRGFAMQPPANISGAGGNRLSMASTMASESHFGAGAKTGANVYNSSSAPKKLIRASLYVIGDKDTAKSMRLPSDCDFIPLTQLRPHDTKAALTKLIRATAPSVLAPGAGTAGAAAAGANVQGEQAYLRLVEESNWMQLVKFILETSMVVADLLDSHNSSVALCLEDGWDVTCQISCLAQLLLDPFYRTINGFRVLIEKEWLSMGHRFAHRGAHSSELSNKGVAPIFLLFMDAVHQIHRQFPCAFEFNDFYLRCIAYHATAGYFCTFSLDSERERVEIGADHDSCDACNKGNQMLFDSNGRLHSTASERSIAFSAITGSNTSGSGAAAHISCVWEFVNNRQKRSPIFSNPLYAPSLQSDRGPVLRPVYNIAALDIWLYFTEDSLSCGSPYDLDSAEAELTERAADRTNNQDLTGIGRTQRRLVDGDYDSVPLIQPDGVHELLEYIERLQKDVGVGAEHWQTVLKRCHPSRKESVLMNDPLLYLPRSAEREFDEYVARAVHKKAAVQMLLRGRLASTARGVAAGQPSTHTGSTAGEFRGNSSPGGPHQFAKYHFTAPETCSVCGKLLWGVVVRAGCRCTHCGFSCHEKCTTSAPSNCLAAPTPHSTGAARGSDASADLSSGTATLQAQQQQQRRQPDGQWTHQDLALMAGATDAEAARRRETRTYESYLLKRGARLRGWKSRYFVLDANMHQLREDTNCKGHIELMDVHSVSSPTAAPHTADGEMCFEVRLSRVRDCPRRVISLMAYTKEEASEWVENINACLQ